ncbi:aminoglycoside phosphotransferase [Xylanimonas cellulosilytica DSM 15894]|uniref:Aminoglycoside phosphotransferase n=1 Tax=Xylanimonas cellulosilytica (strain DSM 15894 / JCM 12276 / CECT 5975 / KCTC 9989 / LMG 20990 / NBRC 107835 / XIL07) TaxID=446471 RepID=D1BTQ3_XYLCX|nr:hypothetical protein [Xylanimonas cellulosilytica]ACZ31032.1 aminoglycoside phosphotransferase [Xylanimonas cellulosilytica DSM 15894]
MNEPPIDLDTDELLSLVQRSWDPSVEALDHLAVGFGAHHWQGRVDGEPRYFVTVDELGDRHTLQSLEAAYAGASALARDGLDFVVAPLEPFVVPLGDRGVSVSPWLAGIPVAATDKVVTATMLERLHAVDPTALGVTLPSWQPVAGPDLPDRVATAVREPWSHGPYGERSREAVVAALDDIARWTARYGELGRIARTRRWVPTHGEPGSHNQMITPSGTVLVDWETLRLAPAERDLRALNRGDRLMLELFDVEWRLDEISQYATWFAGPHGDTADDRTAFEDLLHELSR